MKAEIETQRRVSSYEESFRLIRQHTYLWPRTSLGWVLTLIGLVAFLMVYPGLVWANRAEPFILGMPFVYVWLTFWSHVILACGFVAAKYLWK